MLILTGCWDRRELNQLGIVSAIGIDKDPDTEEYILTSHVLKPSELSVQNSSSRKPYNVVTTTAKTIFEAIQKSNNLSDREGFYAHNKVIIVSEELAKEGLLPILDSFKRGKEIRGYNKLFISKNSQAIDLLTLKSSGINPIPGNMYDDLAKNTNHQFGSTSINIINYYKDTIESGIEPVVGVLQIEENKSNPTEKVIRITGGAAIKNDKLAGYLDETETSGYQLIKGDISTGVISLPSVLEKNKFVSIEVINTNSKIKPEVKSGEVSFTIIVNIEGRLTEQQSNIIKFKEREQQVKYLNKLEEVAEKQIEEEINTVVKKAQQDFKTDIFGMGKSLFKENPAAWMNVKENWPETFAQVPFKVTAKVNISSSTLFKGPFVPEE